MKPLKYFSLLVYFFLYAPILLLIIFSFNESKLNAVWKGFTLAWYVKLSGNVYILNAFKNSLIIAVVATIGSTFIGTMAGFGMSRFRFPAKKLYDSVLYMPMIIPEVLMGISLLVLFVFLNMRLGLTTIAIAHIVFCIPFVTIVVRARLHGLDRSFEEAAYDLGADELTTFRKITFPLAAPGIMAGALLAFTLSFDDFVITFFTAGPGATTLPLKIFSMIKFGVTPEINAISSIIIIISTLLILAVQRLQSLEEAL